MRNPSMILSNFRKKKYAPGGILGVDPNVDPVTGLPILVDPKTGMPTQYIPPKAGSGVLSMKSPVTPAVAPAATGVNPPAEGKSSLAGVNFAGIGNALGNVTDAATIDENGNKRNGEAAVSGVLRGAGTGASIGMALGPVGAAVGAGIGGIAGGIVAANRNKKQLAEYNKNKTLEAIGDSKMASQEYRAKIANYDTGSEPVGYFAKGGTAPIQALDKSSKTLKIHGRRHEQGGVTIGNSEVERGEVIHGNKVFSNRLKVPGTNRTYAGEAQRLIGRPKFKTLEARLEKSEMLKVDDYRAGSLARNVSSTLAPLNSLFNRQEQGKIPTTDKRKFAAGGLIEGDPVNSLLPMAASQESVGIKPIPTMPFNINPYSDSNILANFESKMLENPITPAERVAYKTQITGDYQAPKNRMSDKRVPMNMQREKAYGGLLNKKFAKGGIFDPYALNVAAEALGQYNNYAGGPAGPEAPALVNPYSFAQDVANNKGVKYGRRPINSFNFKDASAMNPLPQDNQFLADPNSVPRAVGNNMIDTLPPLQRSVPSVEAYPNSVSFAQDMARNPMSVAGSNNFPVPPPTKGWKQDNLAVAGVQRASDVIGKMKGQKPEFFEQFRRDGMLADGSAANKKMLADKAAKEAVARDGKNPNHLFTGKDVMGALEKTAPYIDNITNAILTAKSPKVPVPKYASSATLKTKYNINPQLAEIEKSNMATKRTLIDNSTGGSELRGALLANSINNVGAKSNLLGQKENMETDLKNKQATMDADTANRNRSTQNQYNMNKFGRLTDIQTRVSQNAANVTEDIQQQIIDKKLNQSDQTQLGLVVQKYKSTGVLDRMNPSRMIQLIKSGKSAEEAIKILDEEKASAKKK